MRILELSAGLMNWQICVATDVGTDVPQVVWDLHRNEWIGNSNGLGDPQASADAEQARGYRIPIHPVRNS